MIIKRRDFLSLLGATAGVTGMTACSNLWSVPDRLVELALRGPGLEKEVQAICGLCEGGCGITVRQVDGLPVGLKGNPHHPLNRGGLCPVGQSALEVLYSPERLQQPLRRDSSGSLAPVEWEEAFLEITEELSRLRAGGKSDRIAVLCGEPSFLLRDLIRQFSSGIGSPNLSVREHAEVLPYRLSQGVDEVPGFDLSRSDLVLSFGLDVYEDGPAPLHAISAMIGTRSAEGSAAMLHVGTRLSPSASKARRFVAIRPGTHGAFALGVAHVLVREGRFNQQFVTEHTVGFEEWTDGNQKRPGYRQFLLENFYPDRVAQLCGCEPDSIVDVARRFSGASFPVAIAGGEAARSSNATWNVLAAHSLNALVGAFGRAGGVILPPRIPYAPLPELQNTVYPGKPSVFAPGGNHGLMAADPVQVLADRVLEGEYPIDILLIIGRNPVFDSPAGERLGQAFQRVPLVVSFSPFLDETAQLAGLVLPVPLYLESWSDSTQPPGTAFSTIGVSAPVVDPLYESRHPGDILLELSRRLFPEADNPLPWPGYSDYLKSRLNGVAESGQGAIISGSFEESWRHFLEDRGWRFQEHPSSAEFWNNLVSQSGWWSQPSTGEHWEEIFPNPSHRYEFFSRELYRALAELGQRDGEPDSEAVTRASRLLELGASNVEVCLPHFEAPREDGRGEVTLIPFRPITSRGGVGTASPMILEMFGYPILSGWQTWAELSPETAQRLDIHDGDLVAVKSDRGEIEVVASIRPGISADTIQIPVGLGHRRPGEETVGANPLELVSQVSDRLSGTLSLTSTRVELRLVRRRPHGGPAPSHEGGSA